MASYFDEMNFQPLSETDAPTHFLRLLRLLMRDYNMFEELGMREILPPPASKKAVDELVDVEIREIGMNCPVCLKEHELKEIVKEMPCTHKFHSECILPWLGKTNSCPLCRYELSTDDEDYEAFRKEKIRAKQREEDLEILHSSMFS